MRAAALILGVVLTVAGACLHPTATTRAPRASRAYTGREPDRVRLSYFPDGKLRSRGMLVEGRRNGAWVLYYDSGRVAITAHYYRGRQHGSWRAWSPDGALAIVGQFANGRRIGTWRWYDRNGLYEQGSYENGQRTGVWRLWHANGKKAEECHFENDEPNGPQRAWYETGRLRRRPVESKSHRPSGVSARMGVISCLRESITAVANQADGPFLGTAEVVAQNPSRRPTPRSRTRGKKSRGGGKRFGLQDRGGPARPRSSPRNRLADVAENAAAGRWFRSCA